MLCERCSQRWDDETLQRTRQWVENNQGVHYGFSKRADTKRWDWYSYRSLRPHFRKQTRHFRPTICPSPGNLSWIPKHNWPLNSWLSVCGPCHRSTEYPQDMAYWKTISNAGMLPLLRTAPRQFTCFRSTLCSKRTYYLRIVQQVGKN